jgi:hypothetical protein
MYTFHRQNLDIRIMIIKSCYPYNDYKNKNYDNHSGTNMTIKNKIS